MRLFVALMMPPELRGPLGLAQAMLPPPLRPVHPEDLHLTLAFAGEVAGDVAADLDLALGALRAASFPLRIAGLDVFGRPPRSAHAMVETAPALVHLRGKVLRALRAAGLDTLHEAFRPHVTLARFAERGIDAGRIGAWAAAGLPMACPPFAVSEFALCRSHPGGGGDAPRYEVLVRYPLDTPR
jgi:2'-5' RNA ligase